MSRSVWAGWNGAPYKSAKVFILPTNLSAPYESTNLKGPPLNGGNPNPNTAPEIMFQCDLLPILNFVCLLTNITFQWTV